MFLEEAAEEAFDNLAAAVHVFTVAAQEVAKVEAVAEVAENVDTVDEQLQLQEFVQNEDVELTQQVTAYNQSLEDVEASSQEAAAFLIASKSEFVTSESDNFSETYDNSVMNATVSYTAQSTIRLNLRGLLVTRLVIMDFFQHDFMSTQDLMGVGLTIYENNGYDQ